LVGSPGQLVAAEGKSLAPEKHRLGALASVHRLDEIGEGLIDTFALDLHGGGHLSVFLIELFGKDSEFFDLFHTGQALADAVHLPLNQPDDVRKEDPDPVRWKTCKFVLKRLSMPISDTGETAFQETRILINASEALQKAMTPSERKLLSRLNTPARIQTFLDTLEYSVEDVYRCPLRVFRERMGHCFDGAVFAAAALSCIGYPPLILDMLPNDRDDDHILALYKSDGYWGALAQSNFSGLRFREPIFRNLRELMLSYFEPFFNIAREKTLRGYTRPMNLNAFNGLHWTIEDKAMDQIALKLNEIQRTLLITNPMIDGLSRVDERSYDAGLLGAKKEGLFRPSKTKSSRRNER